MKSLKNLEEFLDQQNKRRESLTKFDTLGYTKKGDSSSSTANNCTTWAIDMLKTLGIIPPETSISNRSLTNGIMSGLRSGATIDLNNYSAHSLSLTSPDLYTDNSPSLVKKVVNTVGYGLGYGTSAAVISAIQMPQQVEDHTGFSIPRWIRFFSSMRGR